MIKAKIPTIVAILFLISALAATLFTLQEVKIFTTSANTTLAPQNIRVTNIKNNSFVVSWLTDKPTSGFIEYSANNLVSLSPPTNEATTHYIFIENLKPNTTYSVKINSEESPFEVKTTSSVSTQEGKIVSGQIVNPNGVPVKNALVYVSWNSETNYSAKTSESGNWVIALPNLPNDTILQISAEVTSKISSSAKINLSGANPTPPIALGKSYDFTQRQMKNNNLDLPKVAIPLP